MKINWTFPFLTLRSSAFGLPSSVFRLTFLHLTLVLLPSILLAQDIHFSQFYNSPLTLNPALAGSMDGNLRTIINHRSQWNSISVPFVTSAVSVDSRLLSDRLKGDAVGVGIQLTNDKVGDGNLNNLQILFNGSYQMLWGYDKNQIIAVGVQGGFFQRRIDYSKLSFGSQFSGEEFNTNISSGENTSNFSTTKTDLNAGINYILNKSDNFRFYAGFAMFHLTNPNVSLLNNVYELPGRSVYHAGARFLLKQDTYLYADALSMSQNNNGETNIGVRVEHLLRTERNNINFGFGTAYRLSDALLIMSSVEYQKWKVGFSYDINTSNLHPASNYNGGFELSLIYTNKVLPGKNKLQFIAPCLRL